MNKPVFILLLACVSGLMRSQHDTLKRMRLTAVQLGLSPTYYLDFEDKRQEDYRAFVKDDPHVYEDLSDYEASTNVFFYRTYQSTPEIKFFIGKPSAKRFNTEVFIGLRYSQELNTSAYYTKVTRDTIGVYTGSGGGPRLFGIRVFESAYSFGMHSQKVSIPFGLNIHTNKNRLFWFTLGVLIAPAINFAYTFRSSHEESYSDVLMYEGDTLNSQFNFTRHLYGSEETLRQTYTTKLKGAGYGFLAAIPMCVYFHPFKKLALLKHFHPMLGFTPTYTFSHSKYAGNAWAINGMFSIGLRFNW